jgi:N-acetylmuramoyl-L-alanine amidase
MKITIDPGHGGSDPGASFGPLREKEICLGVSVELEHYLRLSQHEVQATRYADYNVALPTRVMFANNWRADFFLSLHCNADADDDRPGKPQATGSEVWIYPRSHHGRAVAEHLQKSVAAFFPGRRFRGIKECVPSATWRRWNDEEKVGSGRMPLYVLERTIMPAVLIEMAFIDTDQSHVLAEKPTQRKIAESITAAVNAYARHG